MALTLEQLAFQVLDPGLDVAWDEAFRDARYVKPPVPAGHAPVWDDLRTYLLAQSGRPQPLVVTGQVGAGKSMLISRLTSSPEVRARYEVLTVPTQRQSGQEIDDIRVLLVLIIQRLGELIARERYQQGSHVGSGRAASVTRTLAGWLGLVKDGGLPEAPAVLQAATVKFGSDFGEIAFDVVRFAERRQQIFKDPIYDAPRLLRVARALVELIHLALAVRDGAPPHLLLAIDDLDKFASRNAVRSLFYESFRDVLANLGCMTILTVPYFLTFRPEFVAMLGTTRQFAVHNVKVVSRVDGFVPKLDDRRPAPDAVSFFRDLLGALHADAPEFVDRPVIERAALLSAGIPRQFLWLLQRAAVFASMNGKPRVDLASLELSRAERARELDKTVSRTSDRARLKLVHRLHTTQGFSRLFHSLHIVEYVNQESWYAVHPVLEDFVERWIESDRRALLDTGVPEEGLDARLLTQWEKEAGQATDDEAP